MSLRRLASAGLLLAAFTTRATAHPAGQCVLNQDKSSLELIVSNDEAQAYACTASCQYTIKGERPLQTLGCNYNLSANEAENVACDLNGNGPKHFAEVRPTKFLCQPR